MHFYTMSKVGAELRDRRARFGKNGERKGKDKKEK